MRRLCRIRVFFLRFHQAMKYFLGVFEEKKWRGFAGQKPSVEKLLCLARGERPVSAVMVERSFRVLVWPDLDYAPHVLAYSSGGHSYIGHIVSFDGFSKLQVRYQHMWIDVLSDTRRYAWLSQDREAFLKTCNDLLERWLCEMKKQPSSSSQENFSLDNMATNK